MPVKFCALLRIQTGLGPISIYHLCMYVCIYVCIYLCISIYIISLSIYMCIFIYKIGLLTFSSWPWTNQFTIVWFSFLSLSDSVTCIFFKDYFPFSDALTLQAEITSLPESLLQEFRKQTEWMRDWILVKIPEDNIGGSSSLGNVALLVTSLLCM